MITGRTISVVVACYKDAGSVDEMLRRLKAVMEETTPSWEIIYVNDDSPDGAEKAILDHARGDSRLTLINHSRNFGSQMAFTSGMSQSIGDGVVLMDGDLQDPPEVIPDLIRKWEEGFDVVYGIRAQRKESLFRRAAYKLFYRIYRGLASVNVPLDVGDFCVMSRHIADHLVRMPERDRFLRGLRAWLGFRQTGIPYVRAERFSGSSTNSLWDNVRWAKQAIVSLSMIPMEVISYLALFVTGLTSLGMVFYLAGHFIYPDAPRGFATMILAFLFVGSIQLLCLSVIGEYVGRIFNEVKSRPKYIVRSIFNDHRKSVGR